MAFGLGFNKAKVLSAAEKFVAQGKIPAAIEEYRKLLEHDQRDLTLLNTVADLCVRAGRTEEGVKRFCELAELCVEAGLVPRAIATYKRVMKVAPDSVQAMMRLGDLYSMQGLLRDSRTYYLQAVDFYSQNKDLAKARDAFEKVLMLDMENPQLQVRMAGLYADTGKKDEAVATYLSAIEGFMDRNLSAEAAAALQSLLQLDPKNTEGRILLGRSQLDQGQIDEAIQTLQAIPSFASHKVALNLLFQAFSARGDAAQSREIASQLFAAHEDFSGMANIAVQLADRGELDAAVEIYDAASEKLLAEKSSAALIDGLKGVLARDPTHTGALQLVLRAHRAAGSVGEVRETMERLAQVYRDKGELEKARDLYRELMHLEPDNSDHLYLLRQVEAQMGVGQAVPQAAPEPAAAMFPELSGPLADLSAPAATQAPPVETLPARETALVNQCITEAELCITYKQFGRAIETIESGLAQMPGNIRLLEQLLALDELTRQYGKAADCCQALTEAYAKLGDAERAARYGEKIETYRRKDAGEPAPPGTSVGPPSGSAPPPSAGTPAAAFPEGGEPISAAAPPAEAEPAIREVDLSMEWASVSGVEPGAASAGDAESLVEEIEFYSQAGLTSDAAAALSRLEQCSPAHPAIAGFRERLGLAAGAPESTPAVAVPEVAEPTGFPAVEASEAGGFPTTDFGIMAPEPAIEGLPIAEQGAVELASAGGLGESEPFPFGGFSGPAAPEEAPEAAVPVSGLEEWATGGEAQGLPEPIPAGSESAEPLPVAPESPIPTESEFSLEEVFSSAPPVSSAPAFELSLEESEVPPAAVTATPPNKTEDFMASLAGELEGALPAVAPPAAEAAMASAGSGPARANSLQDLFAEFKAEMEEPAAASDIETHYNMGVAFKEMALYDEAIGEFQKAHQIAVTSNDYSNVVQCCSLLATCFLEKGLPQLAVKWYQTALDSPGVDPESKTALLYEIGSAREMAGDRQGALSSFLEVYARNIDYRDVATRISSLQQSE